MSQGDTPISVVGNLVANPELRFTPAGAAVANFRIASTPRQFNRQTNQWEDQEALFLTCNVWRQAAENVAESLTKGMRVMVSGRLRQRSYETREGEKRTVFEVEVDDVGPSLRYATVQVNRNPREGSGRGGFGSGNQSNSGENQGSQGGFGGNQGGQFKESPGGFGGNQGGGFNGGANTGGDTGGFSGGNQPQDDPWNSAPPANASAGGDEPPF